uniref:Putative conserved plasma membrane protein n=1 Tax=Culex tarsalis TaxID=7177 RepID=A0A1Q3FBY1_CULTA
MNFNVFSLLNLTSLLSDYLSQLQLPSSFSASSVPSSSLSSPAPEQVPAPHQEAAAAVPAVDDGSETLLEGGQQQGEQFDFSLLEDGWCTLRNVVGQWLGSVGSPVEFTEFQAHIGKTFLIILCVNLLLIGFYWRKYGSIITDRFIRPSTAKEIEELKLSVARLKLPKEHSPRI